MSICETTFSPKSFDPRDTSPSLDERRWFAVFTAPKNEKSVERHLNIRNIECFLPTYESLRVWKNRQRVNVVLPLFPNYLFARLNRRDRAAVLQSPGVLQIVGNRKEPIPLPDTEIEFLRSDFCRNKAKPHQELVVGRKVRVRRGVLEGLEGVLVRTNNAFRFVLTLELINQHAIIEVNGDDLELLFA